MPSSSLLNKAPDVQTLKSPLRCHSLFSKGGMAFTTEDILKMRMTCYETDSEKRFSIRKKKSPWSKVSWGHTLNLRTELLGNNSLAINWGGQADNTGLWGHTPLVWSTLYLYSPCCKGCTAAAQQRCTGILPQAVSWSLNCSLCWFRSPKAQPRHQ